MMGLRRFDTIRRMRPERRTSLEKIAYGGTWSPTVGVSNPPPTVSDVLSAIGVAQAHGIGTQRERTDAFGRIVGSGLVSTSPAENALRMVGGGVLGRTLASAFTERPFLKGLGAGIGAVAAMRRW